MDLKQYLRTDFQSKFERSELTQPQLTFIKMAAPFTILMRDQTIIKSQGNPNESKRGIRAGVILGDLIVRSNWCTLLPAAKWSNLGMLKKDTPPKVRQTTKKLDGVPYKSYEMWLEGCNDMVDHYVFSGWYDELLRTPGFDAQAALMKRIHKLNLIEVSANIEEVIQRYGLVELDLYF